MPLMFSLFKSKAGVEQEQAARNQRVSELTAAQREDIIAMRADGMLPSQIAQEVGCTSDQVSKLLTSERLRTERRKAEVAPPNDPVKDMQLQIEQLKLKKMQQELEWQLEDRQRERELDLLNQATGEDDFQDDGSGRDPIESVMMAYVMRMLAGQQQVSASQPAVLPSSVPQQAAPAQPVDLTDEEIGQALEQFEPYLPKIRRMPDGLLRKYARAKFPDFSDGTIERAILMIKEK